MLNATVRLNKKPIIAALFLLITASTLVACGDTPTDTPVAASTTAAAAATTAAANANGATGAANPSNGAAANPANGAPGAGGNRGQFNAVTGTVVSYDATSKSLTVKAADGTSQTFDATSATISKSVKITSADLSKITLSSELVQVTGEKAADGTYNATALTVSDANMFGGNGAVPGANGTPGAGRGTGMAPGANGTPGAGRGTGAAPGMSGTAGANVTPGANGNVGAGFGGGQNGAAAGNRLMVRNATISGNTLTGTDMTGAAVTVNLSGTTTITHRITSAATDLTAGQQISVNFRAGQNSTANAAVAITIEQ